MDSLEALFCHIDNFCQQYRNFEAYYCTHVCEHWRSAPGLVSYQYFVEWKPSALLLLRVYLKH
jgi:hypothetical protein